MLQVIYDDQCAFCIRSLKVCRALDVGRRLHFTGATQVKAGAFPELANADLDNAMFTLTSDGRVARGFFAFRRIAAQVPLMWPLLALAYLPGSAAIGSRLYAWIARNRYALGCRSTVCDRRPAPHRPL